MLAVFRNERAMDGSAHEALLFERRLDAGTKHETALLLSAVASGSTGHGRELLYNNSSTAVIFQEGRTFFWACCARKTMILKDYDFHVSRLY